LRRLAQSVSLNRPKRGMKDKSAVESEHPKYLKPITVSKSYSIKKERYFSTIETITMPLSTNASSWK
jgi:hypothetical protein